MGDGIVRNPVGRGDHADVDLDLLLAAAHPPEAAFLQHAQELRLRRVVHLRDLVEKQGAAVGQLEAAEAALGGAGEGPALVAEQLALDEGLGDCRAVDRDERLVAPVRELVNRARHELLARAAFPVHKHGRVARRRQLDPAIYLLHALRLANQLAEAALLLQLMAQEADLARQRLLLDRFLEQHLQPRGVDGLGEIVERAAAHGFHGGLHRPLSGHEQHDRRPARFLQLLEERESIHLGQHEVCHDDGWMLALHEAQCFLAGARRLDLVAPLSDEPRKAVTLRRLVIDDQHLAMPHVVPPGYGHGDSPVSASVPPADY